MDGLRGLLGGDLKIAGFSQAVKISDEYKLLVNSNMKSKIRNVSAGREISALASI
jgi:hypothetical protein